MRSERLVLMGEPRALAAELRALIPAPESVQERVTEILAQVRSAGDEALLDYVRRFDTDGAEPKPVLVTNEELAIAEARLDPAVRGGLQTAVENIRRVAEASLREDLTVRFQDHQVTLRTAPVQSAAVYVPGGRAPYPSTVAMGVVTARVAGVERVAVCAPPGRGGDVDAVVLGACRLVRTSA